jgi:hypothetical protein
MTRYRKLCIQAMGHRIHTSGVLDPDDALQEMSMAWVDAH